MGNAGMTALVSAFARAYHAREKQVKIYDDSLAYNIIGKEKYDEIAEHMVKGISFFAPGFMGERQQALELIVDKQLSPQPLARAAFAQNALEQDVKIGAKQYLLLGAGYDTFAYRQPKWAQKLEIFELDHPLTAADKKGRLAAADIEIPPNVHFAGADLTKTGWERALAANSDYSVDKKTFCAMLGLVMYLTKAEFVDVLVALCNMMPQGSTIVFDYNCTENGADNKGERANKQRTLANGAGESMKSSYSYKEMEKLLADNGFLIYEHLIPREMTQQHFLEYNAANPNSKMQAFEGVNYCLGVKNG